MTKRTLLSSTILALSVSSLSGVSQADAFYIGKIIKPGVIEQASSSQSFPDFQKTMDQIALTPDENTQKAESTDSESFPSEVISTKRQNENFDPEPELSPEDTPFDAPSKESEKTSEETEKLPEKPKISSEEIEKAFKKPPVELEVQHSDHETSKIVDSTKGKDNTSQAPEKLKEEKQEVSEDPALQEESEKPEIIAETEKKAQETILNPTDSDPESRQPLARMLTQYQGLEWTDLMSGNRQHWTFSYGAHAYSNRDMEVLASFLERLPEKTHLVVIGFADKQGDIYANARTAKYRSDELARLIAEQRPDITLRVLSSTSWPGSHAEARRAEAIEVLNSY